MKKKIYKIITIVMLISVIFSVTCINASAFGYTHGDEIPESNYNFGTVRCYDNYAIVNLGMVDDMRYVAYDLETIFDFDNYDQLLELNHFLYDVNSQNPDLIPKFYNYDAYVSFLEFYLIDISTGDIIPLSHPLRVGAGDCHFFYDGFYVFEENPDYNFLYTVIEEFVVNYSGYALQCVCYFNVEDPLFNYANNESLLSEIRRLESEVCDLEINLENEYDRNDLLEEVNVELSQKYFNLLNNSHVDDLFSGLLGSILTLILNVGKLGFTMPGGFTITISGLIILFVLGALLSFVLRKFLGRGD